LTWFAYFIAPPEQNFIRAKMASFVALVAGWSEWRPRKSDKCKIGTDSYTSVYKVISSHPRGHKDLWVSIVNNQMTVYSNDRMTAV
jgi:hypothetical protein